MTAKDGVILICLVIGALIGVFLGSQSPLLVKIINLIEAPFSQVSQRFGDFTVVFVSCEFLLAMLPIIAIHEFAHAFVARRLGLHVHGVKIGPAMFTLQEGKWNASFTRATSVNGLTLFSLDRITRIRRRFTLVIAAGPIANLGSGLICILFGMMYLVNLSPLGTTILVIFGALSILIGASNLFPFQTESFSSDGKQLLMLRTARNESIRWLHLYALNFARQSVNPEHWKQTWVQRASSLQDGSVEAYLGNWFAYVSANSREQVHTAAAYLERCLSYAGRLPSKQRDLLALEGAVFNAWSRNDLEKARQWNERIQNAKSIVPLLRIRADIALHCAAGDYSAALSTWELGFQYMANLPNPLSKEMIESSWRKWKHEIESRQRNQLLGI